MKFAEKIKHLRKEHRLTQAELANKLNVAPTAVSAWERGANRPLMDKITIMSEMFNLPITYFLDVEDVGETVDIETLPVYGNISCGNGLVIYDTPEAYEATPKDWLNGGNYFYLRAKGDSMSGARIFDGDLLLIREQNDVENGEIAAVVIDGESVLKRVYKSDNSIILQSENSKYAPITYVPEHNKNIIIIGKLKKVILNF
ncbi:helix-turn-helix domain-containing protein [Bacillus sp. FJAT-49732]|uniref:Helix-turn-helix domain-containing protein n=1 Tax=Lederbergia citrisecunda TaxID=2833583 RepID=A0A942TL03_9BACI|nr:XRE family transcriptional regulator [Lederbergia citrisecunda]MBS4198582.1 helix-turn-helix domain-containing protein [Lederbergia citrisecunda]